MPTVAVIYTRFSPRPGAAECDSCEKQEERCRAYCERVGYAVLPPSEGDAGVFSDPGISGGVMHRQGLSAALGRLAGIKGDKVLVVDAANRLARDMLVSLTIRHEVRRVGARIEYANGLSPDFTPEGELFNNILAAFASYERDRVRYATSRGMKRRQANGEWFGKPPVGWGLDPERKTVLVPCEEERAALETAARMRRRGAGLLEIAQHLTEAHGLFRGRPWSVRTLRRLNRTNFSVPVPAGTSEPPIASDQ